MLVMMVLLAVMIMLGLDVGVDGDVIVVLVV